jgi:Na+/H+ antiporter NhaA
MSIFISSLAFEDRELINMSQVSVLLASVTSAVLGSIWFVACVPNASVMDIEAAGEVES